MSQPGERAASAAVDTAQTISKGEAPSNAQLNATLDATQDALEQRRREASLNAKGETLAKDAQAILSNTKTFLNEKNPDELAQQFFYHSKAAGNEAKMKAMNLKDTASAEAPGISAQAQSSAEDIFYIGRRTATEIARSKEFRRLLLDTLDLVQGIFWRKMNTEGSQLNQAIRKDIVEGNADMAKTSTVASNVASSLSTQVKEGELMTEDEKRQLSDRLNKILIKVSENSDYQRALNGVFSLLEQLGNRLDSLSKDPKVQSQVQPSENAKQMWADIKTMLERFTGEGSIDPVLESMNNFYMILREDPRTISVLRDGRQLVTSSLQNPERLKDPSRKKEFELLFDKARSLMNDPKYNRYSSDIFDNIRDLLNRFKEDETSQVLADSVRKFVQDMSLDASGKPSIGAIQDSLQQLKNLMLPVMIKQMENIPVARIEGSTKKYDYVLDNIVFSAYDILPDYIKFNFETSLNVDMKEFSTDKAKAYLRLNMSSIKSHINNLRFAYRKKTFPKIEDEGIADVALTGDGITINLEWEIRSYGEEPMKFFVRDVSCDIDNLKVNIKEAQHSILDKMAVKLFSGAAKTKIEDEIETNLRYFGRAVSDQLNEGFVAISRPRST